MASDPDACVPQTLTDFVFDLYDSISLSQLTEEQSRLYNSVFRDLSGKYFANAPWPSPQIIASECNGDPLFLAIYRELTHRHWHAVSRPSLRDRMEGWDVYRELFDELLLDAEETAFDDSGRTAKFYILPEWAFDVLHEFVYQFQGFCQFRTTLYASAVKHNLIGGDGPSGKAPHHVVENLSVLQEEDESDIWNVETVLGYLQRLVAIGTNPKCTVPAYQYFGIFASVTLSRLECLLSDYTACLQAAVPLANPSAMVLKDEPKSFMDVVHGVFAARLSLTYHMGISFIMLRRYKDAVVTVGSLCSYMQRGFKTGQLRKLPNSDQLFKNYDRMIALLAIVTHLCPACPIEEALAKTIREKHGGQLSKDSAGYGDLFVYCSPKFISPAIPDYSTKDFPMETNAYKHQVQLLEKELDCQSTFRQLRSYLKLYTSLNVDKLVGFGNDRVTLTSMKLVQRQLETSENGDGGTSLKSAMDIHYYVQEDTISIDEAEKQRRFENYFLGQVEQSYEIRKDVNAIATDV
mmetsp:Transcript_55227/g.83536  ORF Transcript_55227/g.83536 Transcript_55227/m.83536 type:complete len:520 (+) Transcript_55227:127-1686(+)|eukprot:CAMPEP_0117015754 /NCGR_PEP_ID=MMETSP0472-20121206/12522_1 /TAXON_ID=693140 ORGANISM="Tiarina fusus, Strain LIS" /NCGR_SAMPLE_ID=MMETSP0472 /ASSEMBLY_ACC=CAM_ASM_000603 /LENGTH=519 /DNA_ID=CAMNT_0004719615 /DNA_START=100 /DNA_END=1659 /DNA_ORIENTATION=+